MRMMASRGLLFVALIVAAVSGCATNPVTGKKELTLVSEQKEIAIGNQNYAVSRQMQGGDYSVDPELTAYVSEIGQKLAAVSDRKLPYDFKVLNNSVPNAWALPGGKIAINRGLLLEMNSEAELAAVLGHEIVHAAARHGARSMERGMILQGAMIAAGIAASGSDYGQYAVAGAQLAAGLISTRYGRTAESESDLYGMRYMSSAGYNPQGAVELQETFVRLSAGRPTDWLSGLFASHPPSAQRVRDNRVTLTTLPPGGTVGAERYQAKIAHLQKTQDAYKAFDEGQKALRDGKHAEALAFAEKALQGEPREARFHALRGDVRKAQKRHQDALVNYNRALERDNGFFYYHLQRGLAYAGLNRRGEARADLERSLQLLPTAIANKSLGDLSRADGNKTQAKEFYRAAAQSRSDEGKQALDSLVRLDLPDNPGQYIKVQTGLNNKGYLIADVSNPTSVAVTNLELVVRYLDKAGQIRQVLRPVRGHLPPGQSRRIALGFGPFANRDVLRSVNTAVTRAGIAN